MKGLTSVFLKKKKTIKKALQSMCNNGIRSIIEDKLSVKKNEIELRELRLRWD
jgi:hypothetical protein